MRRRQNVEDVSSMFLNGYHVLSGAPIVLQCFVLVQSHFQPLLIWFSGILTVVHIKKYDIDSSFIFAFFNKNQFPPKHCITRWQKAFFVQVFGGHIAKMLEGRPGEVVEDARIPPGKFKHKKQAHMSHIMMVV